MIHIFVSFDQESEKKKMQVERICCKYCPRYTYYAFKIHCWFLQFFFKELSDPFMQLVIKWKNKNRQTLSTEMIFSFESFYFILFEKSLLIVQKEILTNLKY